MYVSVCMYMLVTLYVGVCTCMCVYGWSYTKFIERLVLECKHVFNAQSMGCGYKNNAQLSKNLNHEI